MHIYGTISLLRFGNISHKSRRDNQNTQFFNNFFSPKNRAVYEIM